MLQAHRVTVKPGKQLAKPKHLNQLCRALQILGTSARLSCDCKGSEGFFVNDSITKELFRIESLNEMV